MLDLDRGLTMRKHPSGIMICMVKSEPGVYWTETGEPLEESMAAEAGFPVKELGRERKKLEKLQAAREKIEREMEKADAEAEEELDREMETDASNGRFRLHSAGLGWYEIHDGDVPVLKGKRFRKHAAEEELARLQTEAAEGAHAG